MKERFAFRSCGSGIDRFRPVDVVNNRKAKFYSITIESGRKHLAIETENRERIAEVIIAPVEAGRRGV